jgi:uncharacterized protein
MRYDNGRFNLAATDLAGFLGCRHLTQLNRAVAMGTRAAPPYWADVQRDALIERGAAHERDYVEHLRNLGLSVVTVDGVDATATAVAQTSNAMAQGVDVIVQGALARDGWRGRADVLRRVDTPSRFGGWSYEAVDTKLAHETKSGTILQLCVYSDLLGDVLGVSPEFMSVVTPWSAFDPERHRFADYAAFYRRAARGLEAFLREDAETYPEPTVYCDTCRWRQPCDERRHADDHLSLVAGVSRLQMAELRARDIPTMKQLSDVPLPLGWRPERGAPETYVRVREQARVQVEAREADERRMEVLAIHPGAGLCRLPAPSLGDVFFDIEGDPFVGRDGQEYLLGYAFTDDDGRTAYAHAWARTRAEEKEAFEKLVDFVSARLERFPELHVYHYAAYEPAALKRLMGRYGTREEAVDGFLRGGVFVDLYAVARHSVRASVESYSIKQLEPFYAFQRQVPLRDAGLARARVEVCLERGDALSLDPDDIEVVRAYNEDDCRSAWKLRDWLEILRAGEIARGADVPRPTPPVDDAPNENVTEWLARITPVIERLLADVPADPAERTIDEHGRWLLANLLDWHRREEKALWWEYFRLAALSEEDLLAERAGLAGLEFMAELEAADRRKTAVHRYRFRPQDCELRAKDELRSMGGDKLGTVVALSHETHTVDIKKKQTTADAHPSAVFGHKYVGAKVIAEAILRIGEHVVTHGLHGDGPFRAARSLLVGEALRIDDDVLRRDGETALDAALRLTHVLTSGVLPVQGPPGTGKTYSGARMICALVAQGKRVGVTANSHKVIRHLVNETIRIADEFGVAVRCCLKAEELEDAQHRLAFAAKSEDLLQALREGANVAGGTAWLWSRPDAFECVDVLFVDEAAQMSLANVLAVSQCAPCIVLLGDPQQLDQPIQGTHPDGCDVSALHHVLGEAQTIASDRGLFLEKTWRLHPDICGFTSELFYAGKLHAMEGRERQIIKSSRGPLRGSGLRYIPVVHSGNQNVSLEEAEAIGALVAAILASKATWVNYDGIEKELAIDDILIITPYNAQVSALQKQLPSDARIGTVDKFQGQEAPIAIYSTATSSFEDAPRGMEFLYSLNRLNVATSRARCISVLVASPRILDAECRSPRRMQLANAFCRFLEMAGDQV